MQGMLVFSVEVLVDAILSDDENFCAAAQNFIQLGCSEFGVSLDLYFHIAKVICFNGLFTFAPDFSHV